MDSDFGTPIDPLEKPKKNMKTIWIIILSVIILLCLCCLCSLVVLWNTGDYLLNWLGIAVNWLPVFSVV